MKAIADVAEAIMGAALLSGGADIGLKAAKALNVPLPSVEKWSDFSRKADAPFPPGSIKIKQSTVKVIEGIIGCRFKRPHLLIQALVRAFWFYSCDEAG